MIIDFHTHIFPLEVRAKRETYLAADTTFAHLYSSAKARLASAEDLLQSMDRAEIQVSCVQGFGWSDPELCRRHNDYLLESAAASGGRIKAFCTLQAADAAGAADEARRVKAGGAAGMGELRPFGQGYDLAGEAGDQLAALGKELGLPLLFHVSEPVGHDYPGKAGLGVAEFYQFARRHPECTIIGAHWGGGLPLYGLMPEIPGELAHVFYDTAAGSLLYDDRIFERAIETVGADRILFASDFPLLGQATQARRVEELATIASSDKELILGGNAAALLQL